MASQLPLRIMGALLLLGASSAMADHAQLTNLGHFGSWDAYSFTENEQLVCYMDLSRNFEHSKSLKRGPSHLMVTHRPHENITDVVSYSGGYMFLPPEDVHITLDALSFNLFTDHDTAWSRTTHADHTLVKALRQGHSLTVRGVSAFKGRTIITDKLDISGASDAYQAISKACGVEIEPLQKLPQKKKGNPTPPSSPRKF